MIIIDIKTASKSRFLTTAFPIEIHCNSGEIVNSGLLRQFFVYTLSLKPDRSFLYAGKLADFGKYIFHFACIVIVSVLIHGEEKLTLMPPSPLASTYAIIRPMKTRCLLSR